MYVTVLREPLARAASEFNYHCALAAEGPKKWLPAWRAAGRCGASLEGFVAAGENGMRPAERNMSGYHVRKLGRFADGRAPAARACALAAAKHNLLAPCVWYLLAERVPRGVGDEA